MENIEDYVNGRIENADNFNDRIYQIHLVILENNN